MQTPSYTTGQAMRVPGLLLACLAFAAPVHAGVSTITDGNSLAASCFHALTALDKGLDQLPGENQTDAFVCMAYISGILSAARHANELAKLHFALATDGQGSQADFDIYCFDWNMRYQKVAQLILRYARNHHELIHQPADRLAMRALQDAFPCPPPENH